MTEEQKVINPNRIYSSYEFCELLGISYRTYQRMRSEGIIPHHISLIRGSGREMHRYLGSAILQFCNNNSEA